MLGVRSSEDVAEMVMSRRAIPKGPEPAKESEFLAAEKGNVDEGFRPGQHRQKTQEEYLIEGVNNFSGLPFVRQITEITQKTSRLEERFTHSRRIFHLAPRKLALQLHFVLSSESMGNHDSGYDKWQYVC
ncbi:hypothetical protein EDC31_1501 [Acidomonas methanolica]|nr:hypothetical protein EDC31_1501 [Acidomonas methanolica]